MKKVIIFVLIFVIVCVLLSGCDIFDSSAPSEGVITKEPLKNAYIPEPIPESNDYLVYIHNPIEDTLPQYWMVYDLPEIYEEMYIYVDGVKTKLIHSKTELDTYYTWYHKNLDRNRVVCVDYKDDNGNKYSFDLSGKLLSYYSADWWDKRNNDGMNKISEEDAIRIAAEFASKADDKFDASKLKVQCIDESHYYIITFCLSINGHRVQGNYRIEVGYEGSVLYYSGSPNPQYDIDISGVDFDLIIELAKAKLDEIDEKDIKYDCR